MKSFTWPLVIATAVTFGCAPTDDTTDDTDETDVETDETDAETDETDAA